MNKMEVLEKNVRMLTLFDIYGELLTDKQQTFFKLYYEQDYSLQEISTMYEVSRNAIYDSLKKVEEHLENYETKLKILEQKNERRRLLDLYIESKDVKYLELLKGIDE